VATVQEQAIEWLQHSRLRASLKEAAIALIPTLPLTRVGIPSCPACERVLCGVCGHCHGLDLLRSHPACPDDNSDMGHDCVAWYQALKAVMTVQYPSEISGSSQEQQNGKKEEREPLNFYVNTRRKERDFMSAILRSNITTSHGAKQVDLQILSMAPARYFMC
jgi:hypothetical protein